MTMIEFVHNPEIQLFTEFINEFGSEPVLQQITEKIRVVVPGDKFAGMFDKEDAFEYNFKTIWYNKEKVDQLGLSQSECFACISHELGHFLLAKKNGITMEEETLLAEANKWELSHGGISGRTASQFVNYILGTRS